MKSLHQRLFQLLVLLLPVQLGKHFWPDWTYVLGIRIDYLSPTIYLTDILVAFVLGLWFFEKLKNKNFNKVIAIKNLKKILLLAVIFLFLFVSCFLAENRAAATFRLIKVLELFLLGFYVAKNRFFLSVLSPSLAIAVAFSSFLAIIQFLKQSSLGGVFWWFGERNFHAATPGVAFSTINGELLIRPYASFSHPNSLAGFLLIGLILTLPAIFKKNLLFAGGYLFLTLVAIFLSFSRTVWLAGILLGIILLIKFLEIRLSVIHGFLSLLLAIILFFSYSLPLFKEEAIVQRLSLLKSAFLMIRVAPVFGIGGNNFIVRLPDFWHLVGPIYLLQPVHNVYFLIAAEAGLIGLFIFLWFIFLTFKRLLAVNYQLLIALVAILLTSLFDHYWVTLQQNQLLLAIFLGMAWSSRKFKRPAV